MFKGSLLNFKAMKILPLCILTCFLFAMTTNAQHLKQQFDFTKEDANKFIKEVYQDKANDIIFSNEGRTERFEDLILNRLKVMYLPYEVNEKYLNISGFALLNNYNTNLRRDNVYNKQTFNPLKYDLSFFASKKVIYRIDNKYVLIVSPQLN